MLQICNNGCVWKPDLIEFSHIHILHLLQGQWPLHGRVQGTTSAQLCGTHSYTTQLFAEPAYPSKTRAQK